MKKNMKKNHDKIYSENSKEEKTTLEEKPKLLKVFRNSVLDLGSILFYLGIAMVAFKYQAYDIMTMCSLGLICSFFSFAVRN